MNFWDSSAVVPLCIEEPFTTTAREWFKNAEGAPTLWALSSVEVLSAIYRKFREKRLTQEALEVSLQLVREVIETSFVVQQLDLVRLRAERVIAVHPLRAADSLQLAAALVVARDNPSNHTFFTLDDRLGDAARREGFTVPRPED